MLLRIFILFLAASAAFAANFRMYLKDGSYQVVREYEVQNDRVHYFSAERSQWEDIPLELVDLERSKKEAAAKDAAEAAQRAADAAEDAALKSQRAEVARVPMNTGVYHIKDGELVPLKPAEIELDNSGTRSILKVLVPVPLVPGKTTVQIPSQASAYRIDDPAPEFYFRLEQEERLALVRLKNKKKVRVIQEVNILPQTNEMIYEQQTVETFRRQVDTRLYKIYPQQPLEPGEYAIIEFTEGELSDTRVWDFGIGPAAK